MEIKICENMREQICYKLESGYFCVLTTKLLSHEFDREGNISNIRGLCSRAKMQTHHLLVQFLGMWTLLFFSPGQHLCGVWVRQTQYMSVQWIYLHDVSSELFKI